MLVLSRQSLTRTLETVGADCTMISMGRTVPTYRIHLESILDRWTDYRRALRDRDRELFDRMIEKARLHSSAASFCAHLDPVELAMISILLEMQREIEKAKR